MTQWQEIPVQEDLFDVADTCCTRGCAQDTVCDSRQTICTLWMQFGMVNLGATLVQRLNKVIKGLSGVGGYIDNTLVGRNERNTMPVGSKHL